MLPELFLRNIIYHKLRYNWNAWHRSWVKWHGMADELHEEGISLRCSINIFCSTWNALCPQYRFFQHSSFVSNFEPCEMYICWLFLYTSTTWEGYICLHIDIFTYFCLHMFLIDSGWSDMAWQMSSLPPWEDISLIWSKNHFFCSMYICVSPKNIFFNIINFVGILSHITFTFPSHYSINVNV